VLTVAAVSALGGLAVAAFGRMSSQRRALIAALCLPAPVAVAFVTWVIYWLFHHSLN
jgi:cytochrome c oxidase subunit IV